MSIISTQPNYGGRQPNNTSYIKQFVVSPSNKTIPWIIKTTSNVQYIEPSNSTKPLSISQDVYVNNLTVEGTFTNLSDARYKENISNLDTETVIKKINQMNPCKYNLKETDSSFVHYGLIAQEFENIYPELVLKRNDILNNDNTSDSTIKTINYIELIPLLIENIKYLNKEVEHLKSTIDDCINKKEKLIP